MDNVLVDFPSGIERISDEHRRVFEGHYDDVPGIFALMDPIDGALDGFNRLSVVYNTYILSTAPGIIPLLGRINFYGCKNIWVKRSIRDSFFLIGRI